MIPVRCSSLLLSAAVEDVCGLQCYNRHRRDVFKGERYDLWLIQVHDSFLSFSDIDFPLIPTSRLSAWQIISIVFCSD